MQRGVRRRRRPATALGGHGGVLPDRGHGARGAVGIEGGGGCGGDGGGRERASYAAKVSGPKTMRAATDVGRDGMTRSRTRRDVERRGCMKVRNDLAMAWSWLSEKVASRSKVMARAREMTLSRSRRGKPTSKSA